MHIDRSFVQDIANVQRDASMVSSIILLAHNLGISVVGEGVETSQQLDLLQQFGAEQVQGFLLSKPVSALEATALLKNKVNMKQILS